MHYVRELLSAVVYPADMPLPVVRSPLGLPLGDRGLLPLPDALPGVGAGVVAGGPYTVPKGCRIPIPGCPTGRGQGRHLRALSSGPHSTDPLDCSTPVLRPALYPSSHPRTCYRAGGRCRGPPRMSAPPAIPSSQAPRLC